MAFHQTCPHTHASSPLRRIASAAGALAAVAGTCVAWGLGEAHAYTLRRRSIVSHRSGTGTTAGTSLRILQLSDIHLLARQKRKIAWIQSLADQNPDLVVLTGDQLSGNALTELLDALAPFTDIPTVFVYGSNDYYSPHFKNPFSYPLRHFTSYRGKDSHAGRERDLPWEEMTEAFEALGWVNLNNARSHLTVGEWEIDCVGVDDPHIGLDRFPAPRDSGNDAASQAGGSATGTGAHGQHLSLGLTHAPYVRVLDAFQEDGCSLVFAGHTHGGQVRMPGYGTIVTNCDIDRHHAFGLFEWPRTLQVLRGDGSVSATDSMWVNVTAGLGTSPYAPFRFACRPEAVLVDIIAMS